MNVERYHYKDFVIVVEQDPDPMNPRVDFDNAGTMICAHSRYNLGDEEFKFTSHSEMIEHMGEQCDGWEALLERQEKRVDGYITPYSDTKFWDEVYSDFRDEMMTFIQRSLIVLPLYLYDHSGITMNTSGFGCQWDSGQVGYIYITRKKAIEEWGKKICSKKVQERAAKYLTGEVETYDQYLTGQVYGRRVLAPLEEGMIDEDDDPFDEDWDEKREEVDSCWGFFGMDMTDEDSYMVTEAKGCVDHHAEERAKKAALVGTVTEGAGI
jgi:hypothetical protein